MNHQELELLPLGELPLALVFCPDAPVLVGAAPGRPTPGRPTPKGRAPGERVAEVLVPDRGVAPGLRRLLQDLGLPLRRGGNSLQTPDDWIGRIMGSPLALVVADRADDLGLPAALAPGAGALGFPAPQPGIARAAGRQAGAPGAAPHRPGAGPDGQPATAGGLKECAPCIEPRLAAPSASVVLPPRCRLAAASLPLGADWPQRPLTPMPVPPLQADHHLLEAAR